MTEGHLEAPNGAVRAEEGDNRSSSPKLKPAIGRLHRALRSATRNDHALIDRMLLPFDLKRPEDYRVFLNIHFEALLALKGAWRQQDSEDFEKMLRCLDTDLGTWGTPRNATPVLACRPASIGAGLGVAYVIRGSRLGAAVLRRGVATTLTTSYLDFVPKLSWAEFLVQLDSTAADSNGTEEAILAARSTFNVFVMEFHRPNGVRAAVRPCPRNPI
jgi:heme oxygenase